MPRRATPPPPGGRTRKSRPGYPKTGQLRGSKASSGKKPAAKKAGGIDIGKFASEVSSNYAKGVAAVGQGLSQMGKSGPSVDVDRMFPSRKASQTVPGALKNAPGNRTGLRRAGWGK